MYEYIGREIIFNENVLICSLLLAFLGCRERSDLECIHGCCGNVYSIKRNYHNMSLIDSRGTLFSLLADSIDTIQCIYK